MGTVHNIVIEYSLVTHVWFTLKTALTTPSTSPKWLLPTVSKQTIKLAAFWIATIESGISRVKKLPTQ